MLKPEDLLGFGTYSWGVNEFSVEILKSNFFCTNNACILSHLIEYMFLAHEWAHFYNQVGAQ